MSHIRMGNSVCNPMNDTTQWEHPDIPIRAPLASRNVREVDLNAPTGAPERTSVWHKESDMAVTEDLESTKHSTEWSPIHPSRNQCPAPEICRTESSTCSVSIGSVRSICKSVCASATGSGSSPEIALDIERSGTVELPGVGGMDAPVGLISLWSKTERNSCCLYQFLKLCLLYPSSGLNYEVYECDDPREHLSLRATLYIIPPLCMGHRSGVIRCQGRLRDRLFVRRRGVPSGLSSNCSVGL